MNSLRVVTVASHRVDPNVAENSNTCYAVRIIPSAIRALPPDYHTGGVGLLFGLVGAAWASRLVAGFFLLPGLQRTENRGLQAQT